MITSQLHIHTSRFQTNCLSIRIATVLLQPSLYKRGDTYTKYLPGYCLSNSIHTYEHGCQQITTNIRLPGYCLSNSIHTCKYGCQQTIRLPDYCLSNGTHTKKYEYQQSTANIQHSKLLPVQWCPH